MDDGTQPAAPFDAPKEQMAQDPFPRYAELREQAAIHRATLRNGSDKWVLTRYEHVRPALSDKRLSHNAEATLGPGHGTGLPDDPVAGRLLYDMLGTDPPEHTRLRTAVAQTFAPRSVERLRPRVQQLVDELLDDVMPRGEADLVADLADPLALRVICEIVGLPVEETGRVTTPSSELQTDEQLNEHLYELRRYFHAAVERTRPQVDLDLPEAEQPGLLHALIAASVHDERMSMQEIVDMLDVVVVSGHLGARTLIAQGIAALLKQRDQYELLQQRPELIESAVEELARFDGAEDLERGRIVAEDVEIAGETIPKGSFVKLLVSCANRDPCAFPDPDRVDIARTPNRHVAFGHGIHFCLGAGLSRIEAQVAIGTVARRLPDLQLACAPEELTYLPDAAGGTRRIAALPVRFTAAP